MGRLLVGLILGFIAFPVLGVVYLMSGRAPAGVTDPEFPMEHQLAHVALESRIHRLAPTRQLSTFTAADLAAGANAYHRECAGCHGLPGITPPGPEPKMFPPPPQLFTPNGYVTDDPVGVSYWKIRNGIRMTGMPSFKNVLTDEQQWQVAAVVASADRLPPAVSDILKQPLFPPPPPPANAMPGAAKKEAPKRTH